LLTALSEPTSENGASIAVTRRRPPRDSDACKGLSGCRPPRRVKNRVVRSLARSTRLESRPTSLGRSGRTPSASAADDYDTEQLPPLLLSPAPLPPLPVAAADSDALRLAVVTGGLAGAVTRAPPLPRPAGASGALCTRPGCGCGCGCGCGLCCGGNGGLVAATGMSAGTCTLSRVLYDGTSEYSPSLRSQASSLLPLPLTTRAGLVPWWRIVMAMPHASFGRCVCVRVRVLPAVQASAPGGGEGGRGLGVCVCGGGGVAAATPG
jgi:hypothetical protein